MQEKIMNETIKIELGRRSVREFTDEVVPTQTLDILYEVALRTATSSSMQASSIIRVTDKSLKIEISKICNQEHVARAPELWIFLADAYRNNKIAKEKGVEEEGSKSMRKFFQSYIDGALTAQNIEIAASSLGLGSVYLGSIYRDLDRLIEILKLPELTFPVVGLCFGYPKKEEKIELKPRMKKEMRVFENSYQKIPKYLRELRDYDEELKDYYKKGNRKSLTFGDLITNILSSSQEIDIIKKIREQGFKI